MFFKTTVIALNLQFLVWLPVNYGINENTICGKMNQGLSYEIIIYWSKDDQAFLAQVQ